MLQMSMQAKNNLQNKNSDSQESESSVLLESDDQVKTFFIIQNYFQKETLNNSQRNNNQKDNDSYSQQKNLKLKFDSKQLNWLHKSLTNFNFSVTNQSSALNNNMKRNSKENQSIHTNQQSNIIMNQLKKQGQKFQQKQKKMQNYNNHSIEIRSNSLTKKPQVGQSQNQQQQNSNQLVHMLVADQSEPKQKQENEENDINKNKKEESKESYNGMTLDQYFGGEFKVVEYDKNSIPNQFDKSKAYGNNQEFYRYMPYRIDEADEDIYTESNAESRLESRKGSSKNRKINFITGQRPGSKANYQMNSRGQQQKYYDGKDDNQIRPSSQKSLAQMKEEEFNKQNKGIEKQKSPIGENLNITLNIQNICLNNIPKKQNEVQNEVKKDVQNKENQNSISPLMNKQQNENTDKNYDKIEKYSYTLENESTHVNNDLIVQPNSVKQKAALEEAQTVAKITPNKLYIAPKNIKLQKKIRDKYEYYSEKQKNEKSMQNIGLNISSSNTFVNAQYMPLYKTSSNFFNLNSLLTNTKNQVIHKKTNTNSYHQQFSPKLHQAQNMKKGQQKIKESLNKAQAQLGGQFEIQVNNQKQILSTTQQFFNNFKQQKPKVGFQNSLNQNYNQSHKQQFYQNFGSENYPSNLQHPQYSIEYTDDHMVFRNTATNVFNKYQGQQQILNKQPYQFNQYYNNPYMKDFSTAPIISNQQDHSTRYLTNQQQKDLITHKIIKQNSNIDLISKYSSRFNLGIVGNKEQLIEKHQNLKKEVNDKFLKTATITFNFKGQHQQTQVY